MKNQVYKSFPHIIARSPLLPFHTIIRIQSTEGLKIFFGDKIQQEAVFLASPSLYEELIKWLSSALTEAPVCTYALYASNE
jgi:lantibiotic biosynthesis protein